MHHPEHQPTPAPTPPELPPAPDLPSPPGHEAPPTEQPQIWVGSLSDYNNGLLHGAWLDAARDEDDLQADIQTMLTASPWTARSGEPAEEWAIFDSDGFGPLRIGEHESLRWISLVAKGIEQHGLAFAAWADVMQDEERLAGFDESYLGHYDNLHAYVEQLINDLGYDELLDKAVPASIRPYVKIDIAATANDGGVWIFDGR